MGKVYLAFFCFFLSTQVTAFDGVSPYGGLNARMRRLTFLKPYGDQDVARKIKQGEFIAGLKFNPYFGLEFSYLNSISADKNHTQQFPELLFGVRTLLNAGEFTVVSGYVKAYKYVRSRMLIRTSRVRYQRCFCIIGSQFL